MEENVTQNIQNPEDFFEGFENNTENTPGTAEDNEAGQIQEQVNQLQEQLNEQKDKYLRLVADFDNFRKRTAKERLDLIQTAGKDVISSLLTVLDDCERAEKQFQTTDDVKSIKEGVTLVFSKLKSTLQSKGLKAMESVGTDFNPDLHEAITEIPAPAEDQKGKVVAEVEKGYLLNDKIIRFAKVVVGK